MAAPAFTEYYENIPYDEKYIFFNRFKEKYRINELSRIKLKTQHEILFNMDKAKDTLITNLCMNESFLENDRFSKESFRKVYSLLKSNKHDKNQMARLIFLIHLSKSNVDYLTFSLFSKFFDSIELIDSFDDIFKNNGLSFLFDYFEELKTNRFIQNHIAQILREIFGKNIKLNFLRNLKISFFNCSVEKLRGFAGINRIYVGLRPFHTMINELRNNLRKDEIKLIIKLEFLRVFVNLTTHALLRSLKNDLNYWNPKNFNKFTNRNKTFRLELGYVAEEKIFEARINWLQSGLNENLNVEKWYEFYEKVIVNQEFHSHLKLNQDGIIRKMNQNFIMGIDFS
ncbi:unnamed protein product [Brachionus calyciflorus]|uniref:Uncharacterized protein n=1 Tax=Brachionus calyciflorus TaxID=104777 RepID=A0A813NYA4_9BILA|nr:unnamed protein product [Brachionus calyciflorus]